NRTTANSTHAANAAYPAHTARPAYATDTTNPTDAAGTTDAARCPPRPALETAAGAADAGIAGPVDVDRAVAPAGIPPTPQPGPQCAVGGESKPRARRITVRIIFRRRRVIDRWICGIGPVAVNLAWLILRNVYDVGLRRLDDDRLLLDHHRLLLGRFQV